MSKEELKPSWEKAPVWAKWLAQDKDGKWFWYEREPFQSDDFWDFLYGLDSKYKLAMKGEPNERWDTTLIKKPKKTT